MKSASQSPVGDNPYKKVVQSKMNSSQSKMNMNSSFVRSGRTPLPLIAVTSNDDLQHELQSPLVTHTVNVIDTLQKEITHTKSSVD
jgi:hypothetical protein